MLLQQVRHICCWLTVAAVVIQDALHVALPVASTEHVKLPEISKRIIVSVSLPENDEAPVFLDDVVCDGCKALTYYQLVIT